MRKSFRDELVSLKRAGTKATADAGKALQRNVKRQIHQNFVVKSEIFVDGVRTKEFGNSAIVRLSPLLTSFASSEPRRGDPFLWILLPPGERLGFPRIDKNWDSLKGRYGNQLSFVRATRGYVVLFRDREGKQHPVYKLQSRVENNKKINFFSEAEKIANSLDVKVLRNWK